MPLLLQAGADATLTTAKGRTALQAAKEKLGKVAQEDLPRFQKVVAQLEKAPAKGSPTPAPALPAAAASAAPITTAFPAAAAAASARRK